MASLIRWWACRRRAIRIGEQNQLTVPLVFKPEQLNHDFHWLLVMARMKPGVTLHQAQQNMDAVTAHIAQVYPEERQGLGRQCGAAEE